MRSTRRSTLLLSSIAAILSGCEAIRNEANADNPVWKHRAGWVMQLEYRLDLAAPSRKTGEPYERGEPEIDARGRRVFVGSADGALYALSAPEGDPLWRFQTLSFVQSAPLYDYRENVVYFGSHDGAFYKVDADSGRLIWRLSTQAEVARRPILSGNVIYFANANDTLVAADAQTGVVRWSYHRTPAMGMEIAGYSGPLLHGGLAYMGFSDGTVSAFDAISGEERWQPVDLAAEAEQATGDVPKYLDVDTTPELVHIKSGPAIVMGSYVGGVFALDPKVGTILWSNNHITGVSEVSYYEQPAYKHGRIMRPARRLLIVATGTSGLWALDPEDGSVVWQRDLPVGGVSRPVEVAGALLMNASQQGAYLLSPIDGSLIDGIHLEDGASGTPAALGSQAFVLTNGGSLLSLRIAAPRPTIETPPSEHRPLEGF